MSQKEGRTASSDDFKILIPVAIAIFCLGLLGYHFFVANG
jgi:hypothetical protein